MTKAKFINSFIMYIVFLIIPTYSFSCSEFEKWEMSCKYANILEIHF